MDDTQILLGKAGLILFTLGLCIGALVPRFHNPRMGLSAHTTAVQSGTALIAFGLFWPWFAIPDRVQGPLAMTLTASFAVLVLSLVLAASFGASEAQPIAGKGFSSSKAKERTVSVLSIGSSVCMLLVCLSICVYSLL